MVNHLSLKVVRTHSIQVSCFEKASSVEGKSLSLSPPPPSFLTTPLPLPLLLSYQTVGFLSNKVKTVRVPIYYAPTGGRLPSATERMNDLAVLVSSNE